VRLTNPEFTNAVLGIESNEQIIILLTLYDPYNPTQAMARLSDGIGIDKVNPSELGKH